jgi:hypothetical protein
MSNWTEFLVVIYDCLLMTLYDLLSGTIFFNSSWSAFRRRRVLDDLFETAPERPVVKKVRFEVLEKVARGKEFGKLGYRLWRYFPA